MKVLVIGSGGREHALAWKSSQDDAVTKVFVCPGNAGTALEEKLENISLDLNNFEEIADFCKNENIALVIIGPEQPLVTGMTDFLQAKDISTFGPSEAAAQLEGSKTFSKDFFYTKNIFFTNACVLRVGKPICWFDAPPTYGKKIRCKLRTRLFE